MHGRDKVWQGACEARQGRGSAHTWQWVPRDHKVQWAAPQGAAKETLHVAAGKHRRWGCKACEKRRERKTRRAAQARQ